MLGVQMPEAQAAKRGWTGAKTSLRALPGARQMLYGPRMIFLRPCTTCPAWLGRRDEGPLGEARGDATGMFAGFAHTCDDA
jgi:hypothetical protein